MFCSLQKYTKGHNIDFMTAEKNNISGFGYLHVAAAAALWASSASLAKFLFHKGLSPIHLMQLRTTISASLLFLWFLMTKLGTLSIGRHDVMYFVRLGVALAVSQLTYLYAVSRIHVAAAILLQYQAPLIIVLYSVLFAREKLTGFTIAAVSGATLGCYFMVGAYNLHVLDMSRAGIISGLISAAAFAYYSVKSEYGVRAHTPWKTLCYALLIAAVMGNLFASPLTAFMQNYSLTSWMAILYISVCGTLLAFGLYNEGIKRIRPAHASITATLEPVIAGIVSYFFLGEVLGTLQVFGAGMVILSVLLLQITRAMTGPIR